MKSSIKKNINSFVIGSTAILFGNICIKAVSFLLLPIYTKYLTPNEIGIYDTINSLSSILIPLLIMGLDSAFSAFYFDENDDVRDKRVFNTILTFMLIVSIVPLAIGILLSKPISFSLFKTSEYSNLTLYMFLSCSVHLIYVPYMLELRLKNKLILFSLFNFFSVLINVLLNVIFLVSFKYGIRSLFISHFIMEISILIFNLFFNKTKYTFNYFDISFLSSLLKFSIPFIPTALLSWILVFSDRYILLFYHGELAVGLYGIASRIQSALSIFISSVSTAYTTFAYQNVNDENGKKQFANVFKLFCIMLLVISFTVSLFSINLVKTFCESSFYESYIPIRDLCYSQIFSGMNTIISYGITFTKKSIYIFVALLISSITNLVLNIIFIPQFGISAAALTTLIGILVQLIYTTIKSKKLFPYTYGLVPISLQIIISYIIVVFCMKMSFMFKMVIWIAFITIILIINAKSLTYIKKFLLQAKFIGGKNINE